MQGKQKNWYELYDCALKIAIKAHVGQKDKAGYENTLCTQYRRRNVVSLTRNNRLKIPLYKMAVLLYEITGVRRFANQ